MLKQIEKLYREAALKKFPINKKHFGSVAEAFPRTIFEKAFEEGFLKAREMAANFLGPPWPYAILNTDTSEITWDKDGIKLIQSALRDLGESEVSE